MNVFVFSLVAFISTRTTSRFRGLRIFPIADVGSGCVNKPRSYVNNAVTFSSSNAIAHPNHKQHPQAYMNAYCVYNARTHAHPLTYTHTPSPHTYTHLHPHTHSHTHTENDNACKLLKNRKKSIEKT